MITIDYKGANDTIKAAVTYANNLFTYTPFLDAIYNIKQFDMADISPQKIADMIHSSDLHLLVDLYWPLPFAKSAHAYDDPLNPSIIHINKMTVNRPVHSICNTLVHQCIHALNAANPGYYFGHGDNTTTGKDNTAPFKIANLAQNMVTEENIISDPMTHEPTDNIPVIRNTTSKEIQESLFKEGIFCFYDMKAILEA
ncbi:MAG: hypothetical protein H6550_14235 [Chitinophagales bacterium]|nr:hypothetical protein [Chitinophagales bacterium]